MKSDEVLKYIESHGDVGRTNREIQSHFGADCKLVSMRINYLKAKGRIVKKGKNRGINIGEKGSPVWISIGEKQPFDSIVNAEF